MSSKSYAYPPFYLFVVIHAAVAVHASTLYTLRDNKLTASFVGNESTFGALADLRMPGEKNVLADGVQSAPMWSAAFVGPGAGKTAIDSINANCSSTEVTQPAGSGTALTLKWVNCVVLLALPRRTNVTWVKHNQSVCAGKCLEKKSKGPKGGHCDRLPGCGHDAGLPYCGVEAMKARCLNATGCTAFTTNGFLYHGGGAKNFSKYPLVCYTMREEYAAKMVNITLDVKLSKGLLYFEISVSGLQVE
jgi:hypothetical protein